MIGKKCRFENIKVVGDGLFVVQLVWRLQTESTIIGGFRTGVVDQIIEYKEQ